MSSRRVVALSNRLPVIRASDGRAQRASGGLVTAVEPVLSARAGSVWVGWNGGVGDIPRQLHQDSTVALDGVRLTRGEVERFYHGFANRTLWPLLHGLVERYSTDHRWWSTYRAINDRFAERAVAVGGGDALVWIHDYHLLLAPALVRGRLPTSRIAFFLHVPFPPSEIWARLPWSEQVLRGALGASTIGFQTMRFRDNFARAALIAGAARNWEDDRLVLPCGRVVEVAVHPISIDAGALAVRAASPAVARARWTLRRRLAGKRVLLGLDRLDYTKGIIERLQAFEFLLEQRPDLRGQVTFLQVAVPSRGDIREYRDCRTAIEAAVGRINGRFAAPGAERPVHYSHATVPEDHLLALYQIADACVVTSLNDGMNLVAKEYVIAQQAAGGSGALVLSRFAGAAEQLGDDALLCNPFHPEGIAGTIELALELGPEERRARLARMAALVTREDVFTWARRHLASADS